MEIKIITQLHVIIQGWHQLNQSFIINSLKTQSLQRINLKENHITTQSQVKSCDKRVQTPGMSPPRAGAWTYCLFTP